MSGKHAGANSSEVHSEHPGQHALLSDLRVLAGPTNGGTFESEGQRRSQGDTRHVHRPGLHILHMPGHCKPRALRDHRCAHKLHCEVQSHTGGTDTADAVPGQVPERRSQGITTFYLIKKFFLRIICRLCQNFGFFVYNNIHSLHFLSTDLCQF